MTPEHSNVLEFFLSLMFKHFPALVTILEIFNSKYGCIFSILKFMQKNSYCARTFPEVPGEDRRKAESHEKSFRCPGIKQA